MTAPDPHDAPWTWQDGDTDNSYGAFCAYRDLGPRRSLSKTVPIYYGEEHGETTTKLRQLAVWSSERQWVARVLSSLHMTCEEMRE